MSLFYPEIISFKTFQLLEFVNECSCLNDYWKWNRYERVLLGIVTRARRPSGINLTHHRELLHPSFIIYSIREWELDRDWLTNDVLYWISAYWNGELENYRRIINFTIKTRIFTIIISITVLMPTKWNSDGLFYYGPIRLHTHSNMSQSWALIVPVVQQMCVLE